MDDDDELEIADDDKDSSGHSIQSVPEVVRPGVIVGPASQGSYDEPRSNMKQSENNESVCGSSGCSEAVGSSTST